MSERRSSTSSSSSSEDDDNTDSQHEPEQYNNFEDGDDEVWEESAPVPYEVIDIDSSPRANESKQNDAKQSEDAADGISPLRLHAGIGNRSSFKRRARLSRILIDDESSSGDEGLYTFGCIPRRSEESSPQRYSHAVTDDGGFQDSVVPEGTDHEDRRESVPMHILSKVVTPDVLLEVKSHLRKVLTARASLRNREYEPSPAKLWEIRKKQQSDRALLNKNQASKIKAGWKVRQCLSSLPDGETPNTFYMTLVRRSMLKEVDALFCLAKVSQNLRNFNKNFTDDDEKTSLTIAIDNKDEAMMSTLIEHGVCLGISIFHAIETNFMDGLKLLLMYDPCVGVRITAENSYFPIGMTPMLLAAFNNNYGMLSLLHEYGHRLKDLKDWREGIHVILESANERRMICLARAQPAYITLTTELNRLNPMTYCLREIKRGRKCEKHEREFSTFHEEIRKKLEDYMCSLLDLICSSAELADLFQFDYCPVQSKSEQLMTFVDNAKTKRWSVESRFELLEKASRENLVRFVTHQQSQLALSYLRFRSIPFLKNTFFAILIGLMFPLLSILYICAPSTVFGSIITFPVVSFYCHMMSDIVFAFILLLNILLKNVQDDRLGEPLTALEWIICLWILGKWVQEIQECMSRGLKAYLRDNWNYTDIILLLLFTTSFVIRIFEVFYNKNAASVPRYQWSSLEPRLIAEGLRAWGYVFVFIRLLGLTRVHRYLGPLQISLAKMLFDIVRFLCLFCLTIGAFAFGLSELYWYYGTPAGLKMFCRKNDTSVESESSVCAQARSISFTSIPDSIVDLFWALFGLFDRASMSLGGKHAFTEYIGKTLLATYHVVAIIVMLNMLIAMMSNSYEATSEHEETAWKFHRTSMWIRFIRREVIRPPPMNLFPNPWRVRENLWRFTSFCRSCCAGRRNLTADVYNYKGRRINRSRLTHSRESISLASVKTQETFAATNTPGKSSPNSSKRPKRRSNSLFEEREVSFDAVEKPQVSSFTNKSAPASRKPSTRHQKRGAGFSPTVLAGVQTALRLNFRANESKAVLRKLVRRYKLKYLVKKKK